MYSVRVEADFAAAHALTHYRGKCERLHGHNYRVRLWAKGHVLGEGGMLVDFGLLKGALREVLSELDHGNLNDIPDFSDDPSAERIARYVFDGVERRLAGGASSGAVDSGAARLLSAVDVYETPTSMARYEPESV